MRSPLLWTFVASFVLLCGVGGWLLTDPATSRSDALKTAGLAGGAVVALYALWLNDRRRRVEEARQEVERRRHDLEMSRAEQDRERISDERFAKSVELLGHEADQVRVGALHALAGLARSRPLYTQTVLDVLCSYLRRPFTHARYDDSKPSAEDERELQVRLTAQRLVAELLPRTSEVDGAAYDLDLTGAVLEYLDLSGRRIGGLLLRYAALYSSTNLSGCVITGRAYFTTAGTEDGRQIGYFRCRGAKFLDHAWFSGTKFSEKADFTETVFSGRTTFKDAVFAKEAVFTGASFDGSLDLSRTSFQGHTELDFAREPERPSLYNTKVQSTKDVILPQDWELEPLPDGSARLTERKGPPPETRERPL
ncbi:pentapeptide repeat-containing protein [Amycolatopsis sp. NBC_01480]|uniref:pentapeptide repeat-containing protein n=1 Tax=Amycolatopsis sp. NBC_01480 TaxID=2903562 RepID=UPI002E2CC3D8|nr:pentapeptide repeat-containing protein [Amycolatopsis sp. NBC_01480]